MFKALVIDQQEHVQTTKVIECEVSDLPDGDVLVRIDYSTLNYKDGLAITGASPVVRSFPMVPGIDFAGTVEASTHADWKPGDRVVLNGWGVGERHWGGLAQYARVSGDWLIGLPDRFDSRQAMIIGTAGYTAALCVDALVDYGVRPDDGEVLVTGATGGVGSFAITLLAKAGYCPVASTGKPAEATYLKALGAVDIIDRAMLSEAGKPLQKERWGGVVDAAGGNTLANACAQTKYRGAIAACGLAESPKLAMTVMPFILRGVALLGVDSVMAPKPLREAAWRRLAADVDDTVFDAVATEVALADAEAMAKQVMAGTIRGRILVDVNA